MHYSHNLSHARCIIQNAQLHKYANKNKSRVQMIKNVQYAFFTMHTCILCTQRKTNHFRKTHYKQISQCAQQQVHVHKHALCRAYNLHVDISVCIIHTYLHYTNTAHAL